MAKIKYISARDWDEEDSPIDEKLDPNSFIHCPVDGGVAIPLGQLGRSVHYRCRSCGYDFSNAVGQ